MSGNTFVLERGKRGSLESWDDRHHLFLISLNLKAIYNKGGIFLETDFLTLMVKCSFVIIITFVVSSDLPPSYSIPDSMDLQVLKVHCTYEMEKFVSRFSTHLLAVYLTQIVLKLTRYPWL